MKLLESVLFVLAALVIWVGFFALLTALPVMLLWNYLMPDLLGLTEIDFWQAFGLTLLTGLLFKNSNTHSS